MCFGQRIVSSLDVIPSIICFSFKIATIFIERTKVMATYLFVNLTFE